MTTESATYLRRIEEALAHDEPGVSVDAVKAVVADELRALDPTMHIRGTHYFNHSYSPDFVVSWPGSSDNRVRYVYIKISARLEHLLEDVALIADQQPIVFGLSSTRSNDPRLLSEARFVSHATNTLVTDSEGLEGFISERGVAFVDLAANALAQGGRGIFDGLSGSDAAGNLRRGFEGALAVDVLKTRAAAETIDDVLKLEHADRMNRLLQAVWVGAGGDLDEFPSSFDSNRWRLTDEALQFLLQYDEIDDSEFWRRIGRQVTVSQLGNVELPDGSVNLEHFMRVNIQSISARACRLFDSSGHLPIQSEEAEGVTPGKGSVLQWFVDSNSRLLGLRGRTFEALFGPNVSDVKRSGSGRHDGITVDRLAVRARYSHVTEAEVFAYSRDGSKRTIKLSSDDRTDIVNDLKVGHLPGMERNVNILVRRVGVTLLNGPTRTLTCNFQTSTAYRRTSSYLTLAELVAEGLPVLQDLDEDEIIALARATQSVERVGLFDSINRLKLQRPPW